MRKTKATTWDGRSFTVEILKWIGWKEEGWMDFNENYETLP